MCGQVECVLDLVRMLLPRSSSSIPGLNGSSFLTNLTEPTKTPKGQKKTISISSSKIGDIYGWFQKAPAPFKSFVKKSSPLSIGKSSKINQLFRCSESAYNLKWLHKLLLRCGSNESKSKAGFSKDSLFTLSKSGGQFSKSIITSQERKLKLLKLPAGRKSSLRRRKKKLRKWRLKKSCCLMRRQL